MAGAEITGRQKPTKTKKLANAQKRKRDDVDAEKLSAAIQNLVRLFISNFAIPFFLTDNILKDPSAPVEYFTDLPLSHATKAGLKASHFTALTDIQKQALVPALLGRDILGAARTGSGKTLAFLIPVLENLYREQHVGQDAGLGALIISPTRELAIQIFEVLCAIGKHGHYFSAGLVIGGKSLKAEQDALPQMNIVVCTPGRILQHLSQTADFALAVDQLRMLVLDEADRIMDMGFQHDVDAIVEYLPPSRQTMLFSATQTKRVSDLARLSLRDPEYIAVHEKAEFATPASLKQSYVLTPLPEKYNTLWSFLQTAKKSKMIVFLSSGKQVRFVFEAFKKMHPGIPLMHLHGRQKQMARLDVTARFRSSRAACMFATDVAARGLDFPAVDWVVQFDCPEDAETYIHRVGRTARYQRNGRAVLFLDPAEEPGMLSRLEKGRVPIQRTNVRPSKLLADGGIAPRLADLCFKDPSLKFLGQRAFASYVRSLHIMKDKEVFDLPRYGDGVAKLAESMGLPGAPRIRYTAGDAEASKKRKNAQRGLTPTSSDDDDEEEEKAGEQAKTSKDKAVRTRLDRMFERTNKDVLGHYSSMLDSNGARTTALDNSADASGDGISSEDELFSVKKRIIPAPASRSGSPASSSEKDATAPLADASRRRLKALSTRAGAAKLLAKNVAGGLSGLAATQNQRLVFDDETGEARAPSLFASAADEADARTAQARAAFVAGESGRLAAADVADREAERARRRAKREKRKARERGEALGKKGVVEEESDDVDEDDMDGGDGRGGGMQMEERPFALLDGLYSDEDEHGNGDARGEISDDEDRDGGSVEDVTALEARARTLLR